MSFRFDVTPAAAWGGLAVAYRAAVENAIGQIAQAYAPEIEAWMKENAPWTDRTANARQTLNSDVEIVIGSMVTIWLRHGVEYGYYLEGINPATMEEMKNAGRWAILNPAIDHFAPKIWATIKATMRP